MPNPTHRTHARWGARLALAAAGLLMAQAPAHAVWNASATADNFDINFLVGSWSGNYTWTTVREGWGATLGTNGSIPNEYTFQPWSGVSWPEANFGGSIVLPGPGFSAASWTRDEASDEMALTGQATVFGALASGQSSGAFVLYDFTLVVQPFSTVEVTLFESDQYISLSHDAGDEGVAFAGFKLYSPTLDLNVPGGANQAYFQGQRALSGGADAAELDTSIGELSYTFSNGTNQAQTHALRFEASALVFTTPVPEPQTWALWLAGLAVLGKLAQRRALRA